MPQKFSSTPRPRSDASDRVPPSSRLAVNSGAAAPAAGTAPAIAGPPGGAVEPAVTGAGSQACPLSADEATRRPPMEAHSRMEINTGRQAGHDGRSTTKDPLVPTAKRRQDRRHAGDGQTGRGEALSSAGREGRVLRRSGGVVLPAAPGSRPRRTGP